MAPWQLVGLSIVLGVVPMLLYAAVLWWIDFWEREPRRLIVAGIVWGAGPSILLVLVVQPYFVGAFSNSAYYDPSRAARIATVGITPLVEESIKAVGVLLLFAMFRREWDSLLDGIIYGAVVGFGFAAVENVVFFVRVGREFPDALGLVVLLRSVAFGMIHALYTSLFGLGLAAAYLSGRRRWRIVFPALGFVAAVAAHRLHNWLTIDALGGVVKSLVADWLGLVWMLVIILLSLRRQSRCIQQSTLEEVALGTITPRQAEAATQLAHRVRGGLATWTAGSARRSEKRVHELCGELALAKRRREQFGPNDSLDREIAALRAELAGLSRGR